jgi:hypothetical protein
MPLEEDIEAETKQLAGAPLVTQRVSDIEVSRRRLRIFLANRAIALGWALKGSCKPCAHRLFTTARWLVPEAQRFLVQCTGSQNRNRRIFEFAVHLGRLLSRIQPRVMGGFLIVLALVGSLDLAMRTTATDTQPFVENSAFRHEPQIPSESKIVSVSKSSEPMQGFVLETASLSGAQIAPVPLPLRKPEGVYKVPNGKGAKANLATQKRMVQQKGARPKPTR